MTKQMKAIKQAEELVAKYGKASVWQDGSYLYVRASDANDEQARREGWNLIWVRPVIS